LCPQGHCFGSLNGSVFFFFIATALSISQRIFSRSSAVGFFLIPGYKNEGTSGNKKSPSNLIGNDNGEQRGEAGKAPQAAFPNGQ
jgi:hypothetical protein